MASNSFGHLFKITTWGESHGKAMGVVIEGCPAGLKIDESEINAALALRAPGKNPYTSPRTETDKAEILSGVLEGKTTGSPICILIPNKDADSSKYEPIKDLLRPGHANYTYLEKYGIFDYRGGGRASARETACRVAAGAIAKKFLSDKGIELIAYIKQIGPLEAAIETQDIKHLHTLTYQSPVFCPDAQATSAMTALIEKAKIEGDSLGGIIEFIASPMPIKFDSPAHAKLEANLAHAMMSLPATKGFEIKVRCQTKTLNKICADIPMIGKIAFKPTSSIMKPQETLTTSRTLASFKLPVGSRHDPCVALRAVPIVEAMVAIVFVDALLLDRCLRDDSKINL